MWSWGLKSVAALSVATFLLPSHLFCDQNALPKHEETASCAMCLRPQPPRGPRDTSGRLAPDAWAWASGDAPLRNRLATLEARWTQHSFPSRRPLSAETPATKRARRRPAAARRQPGGTRGPPGHPQGWLHPTAPVALFPAGGVGGHRELGELTPYHPHRVIARPRRRPDVPPGLLHPGRCLACGTHGTAPLPADQGSGYGPRRPGCGGARAGIVGASRRAGQDLCLSVCGVPLRKGPIQQRVDRVSAARRPQDPAIGEVGRAARGNDRAETAGRLHGDRPWRGGAGAGCAGLWPDVPHPLPGGLRAAPGSGLRVSDG
jgi:hypothetical protein